MLQEVNGKVNAVNEVNGVSGVPSDRGLHSFNNDAYLEENDFTKL